MYLEIKDLKKSYGEGSSYTQVLRGVTTGIDAGKICAILGPSGSGKSTLLNCIGGLETADSGSIIVDGTDICKLKAGDLSEYRRDKLGFVFQFYNLVPNLTVKENIQVCQYLSAASLPIDELLETLGMTEHQKKFPSQLSGGQQQRCAIARALIKNPKLLLCDEPTGALDSVSSREILILLEQINRQYGTTILPTTPFYLLTVFFFANSSQKLHDWFLGTRLYQKHLDSFVKKTRHAVVHKTLHHRDGDSSDGLWLLHDGPKRNLDSLYHTGRRMAGAYSVFHPAGKDDSQGGNTIKCIAKYVASCYYCFRGDESDIERIKTRTDRRISGN